MKSGCRINGNDIPKPSFEPGRIATRPWETGSSGADPEAEDYMMAVAVFGARQEDPPPAAPPDPPVAAPLADERMELLRDLFLAEAHIPEETPPSCSAPAHSTVPARSTMPYLLDEAVNRTFLKRLLLPLGIACAALFVLAAATRNGTADTAPLALPATVLQQEAAMATLEYDLSLLDLEKVEAREAFDRGDPAYVALHTAAGRPPVAVAVRKTAPEKGAYLAGKVAFTRSRFLGWEAEIFDEKENLYTLRVDRFPCKAKSKVVFTLDEKGNVATLRPARGARDQGKQALHGILLDYRPVHRREIGIDYGIERVALEKDLPGVKGRVPVGVVISSDGTPTVVSVNGVSARRL